MTEKFVPLMTVRDRKVWCGPYALAAIAGISYDDAYQVLIEARANVKISDKMPIKGVFNEEMEAGIEICMNRKRHFYHPWNKKTSLRKALDYMRPNRIYLVNTSRHYIVIDTSNWTMIDNQTKGWISVHDCNYIRTFCRMIAEIGKA